MAIDGKTAPKWLIPAVIGAALLAVAAALYLRFRGAAEPEPARPADAYDTRYARMHDPVYLKELDAIRQEQKGIARLLAEAQAALEAAKEKGEDSAEFRAAQAKMAAAKDAFQKNRIKAQTLVRDRIEREDAAIKAKSESSKEKGE